jgi:ABC-type sugar transport system ATPase subunit
MASVELNHVDKVYEDNIEAIDDVNLQSGDQKATALRMIAGRAFSILAQVKLS